MEKENLWTHEEYLLSLAFYCLNPNPTNLKEIQKFSKNLSAITHIFRSPGSVGRRIGNFQSLDPKYTENGRLGLQNGGSTIRLYWKKYVQDDPTFEKLKIIYSQYERGIFDLGNEVSLVDSEKFNKHLEKYFVKKSKNILQDEETEQKFINETDAFLAKNAEKFLQKPIGPDKPENPPPPMETSGKKSYRRNPVTSATAIRISGYKCQCDETHESFLRRVDGKNYTEAHHLIPVSAQNEFPHSLDVLANIVSLCSNCHNNLHYGKDNKKLLSKLFEERKDRLHQAGIDITFEKLLEFYTK